MLVRCIDNQDVHDRLIVGKLYQAKNWDDQLVDVYDETGEWNTYVVERFEIVDGSDEA